MIKILLLSFLNLATLSFLNPATLPDCDDDIKIAYLVSGIPESVEDGGEIRHLEDGGEIRHFPAGGGEIRHFPAGGGEIRHFPAGGGEIRHFPAGGGEIRHFPAGGGEIRHFPADGGEIRHFPADGGEIRHFPAGGGEIRHFPAGGGEIRHFPAGGGEIRHFPAGGGEIRHFPADGGEIRHFPADGGEIRHFPAGGGEIRHFPAGGGERGQFPAGGGERGQFPAGGGEIRQFPAGGGEIRQFPAGGGEIRQFPAGGGEIRQFPAGGGERGQFPAGGGERGQFPAGGRKMVPFPWNKMKLPKHVVPVHYDLLIHPNLTSLTFTGLVKIEVTVAEQTSSVILHSKYLRITKATIQREKGTTETRLMVLEYPPFEQIALVAAEPLQIGQYYTISIEYAANLSDSFHGFYKSTHTTPEGEVRVLAATQFEPTSARMAFPCFDEPAFKAKFSVKVRREAKHLALSNMPLVKSVNINKWLVEDQFQISVKMSTYLLAIIVSDFKSISKMTSRGIKVSIYTAPDKINQADYALDAAVKLLDFYEGYFSIPYPLPKQDLAAIPDFQSGAMENWGLTTYRESALLYDPKKSSASSKLGITMVIAHELAHQWFGNLVTMEWWNDLWLNEGFAKFMEFVSVNITHPELKVEDYFLDKYFDAMKVDALKSSHPISNPVEDPAQILEMFDDVSYDKGACILNMLQNYLGSEVFKAGLVKYLKRFSYQNTQSKDLWDSLSHVCSADESQIQNDGVCAKNQETISTSHWTKSGYHDIKTMMNTWTLQKGFPLVTVTVQAKKVHLQQEPYKQNSQLSSTTWSMWHVPLTYVTSESGAVQRFLLRTKTDDFVLPQEVDWIKFNVEMSGYYIVHYGDNGWDNLIRLLKDSPKVLSSNDRASLINSAFQLVSAEKLSITTALDLTLYLKYESEITPVFQGLNELIPLYKLLEKRDMKDTEQLLKGYIVKLFQNIIDNQSWDDEGTVSERMLRSSLLTFACVHKYQPCVDKAKEYFMKWKNSGGTLHLPSDIKTAVYAVGTQTDEGWDFLFSKYQLPEFSTEKNQIEVVLSLSQNKGKLQWLMDQGLQGDVIKTQDLPHIVVYVGRNPDGYQLAWNFLKKNWQKLVQKFELGSYSIAHMITGVTNKYSTQAQLAEVKKYFSSLDKKSSELRAVQQAVETIEENIKWMGRNLEQIKKWLQNQKDHGACM